jgi:hypothetical protein
VNTVRATLTAPPTTLGPAETLAAITAATQLELICSAIQCASFALTWLMPFSARHSMNFRTFHVRQSTRAALLVNVENQESCLTQTILCPRCFPSATQMPPTRWVMESPRPWNGSDTATRPCHGTPIRML